MPQRPQYLRHIFTMAILAVLMVSAGAPGLVCASMAGCPTMQPVATDCHEAPAVDPEGAASPVESSGDCCCVSEAPPPVSFLPVEVTTPSLFEVAVTAPPLHDLVATPLHARLADAMTPPPRPAGRDLISLFQTLLN